MRAFSIAVLMLLSLFVAGAAIGQTAPMAVRIGNSTANDAMAEVNDKFAELLTKYSNARFKATAFQRESLGSVAQMVAASSGGLPDRGFLPLCSEAVRHRRQASQPG